MQKKYDFNEILKEYNEKHVHEYKAPPEIFNIIIVHVMETGVFYVTYSDKSGNRKEKRSLEDFLYYHVSSCVSKSDFTKIILLKEEEGLNLKIKIWPPSKIRYAYLADNYFNKVGPLYQSCMRHKTHQKSLNFYIKNNLQIVVIVDKNKKIHARAMLWKNVKHSKSKAEEFTYLDRVYHNSAKHMVLLHDFAAKNNWPFYPNDNVGNGDKNYYKEDIVLQDIYYIPYLDTFRYLYYKNNFITGGYKPPTPKLNTDYMMCVANNNITSTYGYYQALDPDSTKEVLTDNYISKKDAIFVKRYNGFVLKNNIVNINGDYYSSHDRDKIIKTQLDGYILKENLVNEAITNDTMSKNMAIYSPKYDGYVHKSNIIDIRGEIYHKKDTDIVCFNIGTEKTGTFKSKWYHILECFINYDRKKLNKELAKPALTPKGNKIFVKQPKFFDVDIPEDTSGGTVGDYMRYFALIWSFAPDNDKFGAVVARQGDLIPKEYTLIAYDLAYNAMTDSIEYQEVYYNSLVKDKTGLIKLVTGEFIVDSRKNREYLKKFNNKYYIKKDFEPPDKNQLKLF